MNEIHYICVCQSIFTSLSELNVHQLTCEQSLSAKNNKNVKEIKYAIPKKFSNGKSTILIEVVKKNGKILCPEKTQLEDEPVATNSFGRKLPIRTKVPFLSRAVPLSTDHSFERCNCGAVFVTRIGKRQHQARFCKFSKSNKVKHKTVNEPLEESEKYDSVGLRTNNNKKSSVIEYQDNTCVLFLRKEVFDNTSEGTIVYSDDTGKFIQKIDDDSGAK